MFSKKDFKTNKVALQATNNNSDIVSPRTIPCDNRDHSSAVLDRCADVLVNRNRGCEISGMKA